MPFLASRAWCTRTSAVTNMADTSSGEAWIVQPAITRGEWAQVDPFVGDGLFVSGAS